VRCWLLARIFKTAEQQGATARTGARYNMESTDMGHASAQFLGGPNMLTGPTDDYWRAVRKAVAPAFSAKSMRCARPLASACAQRRALPPVPVVWMPGSGYARSGSCTSSVLC